ncbi:MAG TPA: signal peptidase I [Actinomycetospora sp.]|nr:signal peptidase I [Actinomycetospora sp.]
MSRDGATTTAGTSTSSTTGTTRSGGAGVGPGRHRRAGTGPGRDDEGTADREDDADPDEGDDGEGDTGRAGRRAARSGTKGKAKRKGSFWRELPLLIVVAVVLTFVIQTFLARIYVIPSASMERTLHGCSGCANDRVAVDKVTYRFSDPAPGDVVVFRGPPSWGDNGEVSNSQRSDNVLVRGLQSGLSLVGLAPPDEKDFVKRVIAVGGQTVECCDPQNRVTVDGRPLNEPYIYYQPDLDRTTQDPFPAVRVPEGQLWVMGDNRNNSADARVHGPISVTDVIGKARVIVLPVGRWSGVSDTDPQARVAALGAPAWQTGAPLAAGVVGAVPLVMLSRRWRRSLHGGADGPVAAEGGPAPPPSSGDPDR